MNSTLYPRLMFGSGLRAAERPKFGVPAAISFSVAMSSWYPGAPISAGSQVEVPGRYAQSFQLRVSLAFRIGLYRSAKDPPAGAMYLLAPNLTAVLPSPVTSYTRPNRGAISFQFGRLLRAGKERVGANRPAIAPCCGVPALK